MAVEAGIGRLLTDGELADWPGGPLRSSFVVDGGLALTAWHCVRDVGATAASLWLRLQPRDEAERFVDVRARYLAHNQDLDVALLVLEGDGSLHEYLRSVALPLGRKVREYDEARVGGFPQINNALHSVLYSGTVQSADALVGRHPAARVLVPAFAARYADWPRGMSGGPLLRRLPDHTERVVGVVVSYPRASEGRGATGGSVVCRRIVELCHHFPQIDALADDEAAASNARQRLTPDSAVRQRVRAQTIQMTQHIKPFRHGGPMPLDDVYVELRLLDRPTAWRLEEPAAVWEATEFDRFRMGQAKRSRLKALATLRNCPRAFIVGKPGSGKTTLLRAAALSASRSPQEWSEDGDLVTLFVAARDLDYLTGDSGSLLDWIEGHYAIAVRHLLEGDHVAGSRQVFLIVDGIDEAPGGKFDKLIAEVKQLAARKPDLKLLVSCRTQTVSEQLDQFYSFEIAELSDASIKQFLRQWFKAQGGSRRRQLKLAGLLEAELESKPYLRDLARNPLQLSLIATAHMDGGGTLPKGRARLLARGVLDMVSSWDQSRGVVRQGAQLPNLSDEEWLDFYSQIALRVIESGSLVVSRSDLLTWTTELLGPGQGPALIQELERAHGLVVERSHGLYSFVHLALNELLAARAIMRIGSRVKALILTAAIGRREVASFLFELSSGTEGFASDALELLSFASTQSISLQHAQAYATRMAARCTSECPQDIVRGFYFDLSIAPIIAKSSRGSRDAALMQYRDVAAKLDPRLHDALTKFVLLRLKLPNSATPAMLGEWWPEAAAVLVLSGMPDLEQAMKLLGIEKNDGQLPEPNTLLSTEELDSIQRLDVAMAAAGVEPLSEVKANHPVYTSWWADERGVWASSLLPVSEAIAETNSASSGDDKELFLVKTYRFLASTLLASKEYLTRAERNSLESDLYRWPTKAVSA